MKNKRIYGGAHGLAASKQMRAIVRFVDPRTNMHMLAREMIWL